MIFNVYDITIPEFIGSLSALSDLLDKAKAHAESKKIDMSVVLQARLIMDQFPLSKQIQMVCDTAKLLVSRLTSVETPVFPDTETTYEEFKTRIEATISLLKTVKPDHFNGWETKAVTFHWRPDQELAARNYVLQHVIPNFYFHLTTAYSILRANGVALGKGDYLRVEWKS